MHHSHTTNALPEKGGKLLCQNAGFGSCAPLPEERQMPALGVLSSMIFSPYAAQTCRRSWLSCRCRAGCWNQPSHDGSLSCNASRAPSRASSCTMLVVEHTRPSCEPAIESLAAFITQVHIQHICPSLALDPTVPRHLNGAVAHGILIAWQMPTSLT